VPLHCSQAATSVERKLHEIAGVAGFSPSLCCRTNAPGDVHLAIIRGTPSCCAEIGGEHQARNYDEPNDEPTHVFSPRAVLVALRKRNGGMVVAEGAPARWRLKESA
jgi:hypothetical protein